MRVILFCCLAATASAFANQGDVERVGETLTLSEARSRAVRNSATIEQSRFRALAAGQRPLQTRSALLPVLGASLTGAGASSDTRIGAGGLNNPAIFSRLGTGVTASQLLFDFGRTQRLVDAAELQATAADDSVRTSRSDVLLDVTRASNT